MAWDGSGNFTRTNGTQSGAATWADADSAGNNITTSQHDTHDEDLADGIAATLTKNNESKPTADFKPNADATYSLGSALLRWVNAFFSGIISTTDTTDATSTTAASVKTAGGLAVAKKLYVGDLIHLPNNTYIKARNAANSADQFVLAVNAADVLLLGGSFTASVANAGTLTLGTLQKGLLVIVDNVDFCSVFVVSNLVTYELSDPDNKYSATAGTGSMTNLYNSAGSVVLQNNSGGARTYSITFIQ